MKRFVSKSMLLICLRYVYVEAPSEKELSAKLAEGANGRFGSLIRNTTFLLKRVALRKI